MNFFEQQDNARRNTRWLVLVFALVVLALILLTNLLIAGFLFFSEDYNIYSGVGQDGLGAWFSLERFGLVGLGITATIGLVILARWIQLSTGGKVVAESMGGVRLLPQTDDPAQRRCLNVVEEMALAANMPVPATYLLADERGINAFAAGIAPGDAVIAVTRGAIDHLTRKELQGVIGHEFSHILNGDMRLNIRLAALLKGITFISDVGSMLLRSQRRMRTGESQRGAAALPLAGLALLVLGWLGSLGAGYIKAAISRQREFLADASAVQFTRDNSSIADALKVIGGYVPGTLVHAARAVELSHIFFGQVIHPLWQSFATHPPLPDRIRRLEPAWNGEFIRRKPRHSPDPDFQRQAAEAGLNRAAVVAAAITAAEADREAVSEEPVADAEFAPRPPDYEAETATREGIPVALVRHAHEPLGAQALLCALLLDGDEGVYQRQLEVLRESGIQGLTELSHTLYPAVAALGPPMRLPLVELCLPALKAISARQYRAFKRSLLYLVQADARTELHEWCLYQLVRHYLDPEFLRVQRSKPRYRRLAQVSSQVRMVLSVLAHEGSGEAGPAFRSGVEALQLGTLELLPREECGVAAFSQAVHSLADLYPLRKPELLKAMALAAADNADLDAAEREIITAIAAVMDCPAPELP